MITETTPITNLRAGETVLVFPSFGHLTDSGQAWRINISGAVIEPGHIRMHKKLLLRLLQRVLNVQAEELQSPIFHERIRAFTAAPERGKRIAIRVGSRIYRLRKKSKRNGHFRGTLRLEASYVHQLECDGLIQDGCLRFDVVTPDDDDRPFSGQVFLIPPTGLSVISDIDDTIKYTEVTSRRALLANTFLHEFKSIDGMAELYRNWASEGATFHYVSSSPWQLYGPLSELFEASGFPAGTFHLRNFRLRDHMLRRVLLIRRRGKGSVIKSLVQTFPGRQFLLVGDSGERDPELYAAITRRYPDRVAGILIRELANRHLTSERCRKVFRRISDSVWKVFRDPGELRASLPLID